MPNQFNPADAKNAPLILALAGKEEIVNDRERSVIV